MTPSLKLPEELIDHHAELPLRLAAKCKMDPSTFLILPSPPLPLLNDKMTNCSQSQQTTAVTTKYKCIGFFEKIEN